MQVLDACGLICPMPVIRTQERVATLASGEILEIRCTDPGALHDIPSWCRVNGHQCLSAHDGDDDIVIRIRVGDTD